MQQNAKQKRPVTVEEVIAKQVRLYDNGGKTLDRYTAVYMFDEERNGAFGARGMNAMPFHGIGLYCSAAPGRHLGRRIAFGKMPEDCQRLVRQDVGAYVRATAAV
ncbi:hypothetical protein [Cupriavidus sp. TMH.W2]|uniref:hypothetical protein n=1 Tax=Cupriavidus sp. TMH.W2 TaxID=3434465 RepID=UPI003D76E3E8